MRASIPFVLVPLVAGLSACGMAGEPGRMVAEPWGASASSYADSPIAEIEADVEEAMTGVESLRVAGTFIDGEDHIQMDVRVSGRSCAGSLEMAGAGSMEILVVDKVPYFKADEEFWVSQAGEEAAAAALEEVGDRWTTDSSDAEGLGDFCDIDELTSGVETEGNGDDAEVEGLDQVDGVDAVVISFDSDDGRLGRAWVATSEPHHLLKSDVPGEGRFTFSEYGEVLDIEEPAPDDVFDLGATGA